MQNKIEILAKQACGKLDLIFVDLRVRGDKRQPIFEIYADTEKGITLKECEVLTRELQDLIDMDDQFVGDYRLNVSSPGLDKPLKQDFEFKRNIGQQVNIKMNTEKGIVEKSGELTGFDNQCLQIMSKGGLETIERINIIEAKVKLKW